MNSEIKIMKPNIGKRIKVLLGMRGMSVVVLAELLAISKREVYWILKKQHLNTELLIKISEILKHDFFQYFQPDPVPGRHKIEKQKLEEQLQKLRKENALLKQYRQTGN